MGWIHNFTSSFNKLKIYTMAKEISFEDYCNGMRDEDDFDAPLHLKQPIYYAKFTRKKGYGELKLTEVKKVGRKSFETSKSSTPISYETMLDENPSNDHTRYFHNRSEYDDLMEEIRLRPMIRLFMSQHLDTMSVAMLKRIEQAIEPCPSCPRCNYEL